MVTDTSIICRTFIRRVFAGGLLWQNVADIGRTRYLPLFVRQVHQYRYVVVPFPVTSWGYFDYKTSANLQLIIQYEEKRSEIESSVPNSATFSIIGFSFGMLRGRLRPHCSIVKFNNSTDVSLAMLVYLVLVLDSYCQVDTKKCFQFLICIKNYLCNFFFNDEGLII